MAFCSAEMAVPSISEGEFGRLLRAFESDCVHLEMRDAYGTEVELPHMAAWAAGIAQPMVDAGEDIRWVPRRLVSSVAFPGNDFYLFDHRTVVFLLYSGDGLATDRVASTDPDDIQLCRSSFESAWKYAIPHRDYQPG